MTLKPSRSRAPPKWRSILCPIIETTDHLDANYPNHSSKMTMMTASMSFLSLAERRHFSTILDTVRWKRRHQGVDAVTEWLHANSPTPLHALLVQHPPTPLFITLLAYASPHAPDSHGRNLLHLACYTNCHISLVVHLLRTLSPSVPDAGPLRRLPLHWNCAATHQRGVDANLVAIATLLKERYPAAIHVRDAAGHLPNDVLSVRHNKQKPKKTIVVVAPDTMVVLPPAPLRETVSDLTNDGGSARSVAPSSTATTTTTTSTEILDHEDSSVDDVDDTYRHRHQHGYQHDPQEQPPQRRQNHRMEAAVPRQRTAASVAPRTSATTSFVHPPWRRAATLS